MKKEQSTDKTPAEAGPDAQRQDQGEERGGLMVCGKVAGRTRREFTGKDGKKRFLISLVVSTPTETHNLERWAHEPLPPGTPRLGEYVKMPVRVRSFVHAGAAHARLVWGERAADEVF
jgi:hypothetical protein